MDSYWYLIILIFCKNLSNKEIKWNWGLNLPVKHPRKFYREGKSFSTGNGSYPRFCENKLSIVLGKDIVGTKRTMEETSEILMKT